MPLTRFALAAAATCLFAGAAFAQSNMPAQSDGAGPPPAASDQSAAPPASADQSAPAAQTGAASNTSATVDQATGAQVIASAPVPDTPANRAKYGKPLSRAGKRTKPAGN